MTIASAITAAQGRVADCYTAISNKGGTLPATQNLSNMPATIASIPSGGSTKYGCTVDNLLGDVDANGKLQMPADTSGDIVFTGVEDVADYALAYKFFRNPNLTHSVSFPDLTTISGTSGCQGMCSGCNYVTNLDLSSLTTVSGTDGCNAMFFSCFNLASVDLYSLTTVSGTYGCRYMFQNCTGLTSVDLSSLTTISGQTGCGNMFIDCTKLPSVVFNSLTTITGYNACQGMFQNCRSLASISFPALTTTSFGSSYINQFNSMFNSNSGSTSGAITMHFPSNLQSTISGLTGYPNFGATSGRLTLAFDLPATS